MRLPPPNFGPLTIHKPQEEDPNHSHSTAIVPHTRTPVDPDFTQTQQSWLASLPLIGRLWGSRKVLKKTFEVNI